MSLNQIKNLRDPSEITKDIARQLGATMANADMRPEDKDNDVATEQYLGMAENVLNSIGELLIGGCDVSKIPGLDLKDRSSVEKYAKLVKRAQEVLRS